MHAISLFHHLWITLQRGVVWEIFLQGKTPRFLCFFLPRYLHVLKPDLLLQRKGKGLVNLQATSAALYSVVQSIMLQYCDILTFWLINCYFSVSVFVCLLLLYVVEVVQQIAEVLQQASWNSGKPQLISVADLGGIQGCERTPLWTAVNYYS